MKKANGRMDYTELMDKELQEYYDQKMPFISDAMEEFIPEKITPQKLDQIAGPPPFAWDIETLQKSFFDPIRLYIDRSPGFVESTCFVAAMEALSCDVERYRLLIPIPEYLIVAALASEDIWDNRKTRWGKPTVHHIYLGGLGGIIPYYLWSLISYVLVNHLLTIEDETRLRLYETYNFAAFKAIVGIGMKLWLRQEDSPIVSEDEYLEYCVEAAAGFRRLCLEVTGILAGRTREEIEPLLDWADYVSLGYKLEQDLVKATRTNELGGAEPQIWGKDNYLVIAALARANEKERRVLRELAHRDNGDRERTERLVKLLYHLEAPGIAGEKIDRFLGLAERHLDESPLDNKYKELFLASTRFLIRLARDERF